MQAIHFIGFSIFMYGLVAGYYAYSAFKKVQNTPRKMRRLGMALAIGFVAVLLSLASIGFF
ncbi:hypothetical protein GCM10027347_40140 [Larkinella harenae]